MRMHNYLYTAIRLHIPSFCALYLLKASRPGMKHRLPTNLPTILSSRSVDSIFFPVIQFHSFSNMHIRSLLTLHDSNVIQAVWTTLNLFVRDQYSLNYVSSKDGSTYLSRHTE